MERDLWKNYPAGQINEKIEYWVDVWEDLVDHYTKTHYGLELVNPHAVLKVLIDEIQHNELRNKETRKYLFEAIAGFLKSDPVVKQYLSVEFGLLLQGFNDRPLLYLLQTTKAILPFFQLGQYFCEIYGRLREILATPDWKPTDASQIDLLASNLMVELLLKGYHLESIKRMPHNIFCDVHATAHNFPTETVYDDVVDLPEEEQIALGVRQSEEVKDLNIDKRLSAFTRYFFRKPHECIFIFEVEGLKGEAQFEIGPVTFYSPQVRSFIQDTRYTAASKDLLRNLEWFQRDKSLYFANAAIRISCVDSETGKLQAPEIADKALDLLRAVYKMKAELRVMRGAYICLAKGGRLREHGFDGGERHRPLKVLYALDLKIFEGTDAPLSLLKDTAGYLFLPKEKQSPLEQKVSDCLHWFRKGEEAERIEERLLHYWIVMEKTFTFSGASHLLIGSDKMVETKIFLISELFSSAIAYSFIFKLGWTLHSYLRGLLNYFAPPFPGTHLIQIPKALIEKCCLQGDYYGRIELKQIIKHLTELGDAVDKKLVKLRILEVKRFYQDGDFAKEEIKRIIKRTKDDVFLIYRFRNSIVHNAHYDASLLHPFVEKAAQLAQLAITMMLHERAEQVDASVEQIFISKHCEVQRILDRLEKGMPIDSPSDIQTWNTSKSAGGYAS